jgi:hypothetical protein
VDGIKPQHCSPRNVEQRRVKFSRGPSVASSPMPPIGSTPSVGEPLPRAANAYVTPEKLDWMLTVHGHGLEWERVFRITPDDAKRTWSAISQAIIGVPVSPIRDASPYGVSCEVRIDLTLGIRAAPVVTAWHYGKQGDPPRLVTAFPTS